ncbi:hypothetical protein LUX39_11125 [Actinomadura madurae]|nr:hypothetical protein [Actinomadura madurae]MCP9978063.1 hypothetical protein [Actinomadura madurae]MCQ0010434.1 hypothetical protein [Actinomadura madurae]MCQ0014252.1 hypothetical protein [Actinomadura madurae]
MSAPTPGGRPSSTSGAAWCGVNAWVWVASNESTRRAMPKSASAGSPYRDSSTFCGLTSRWSTSVSWVAASAPAIFTPIRSTSANGSGPSRASRSVSAPCSKYSIAM